MAAYEDYNYGCEKGGHGVVPPVVNRDGVVEDGGPDNTVIAMSVCVRPHLRIPL